MARNPRMQQPKPDRLAEFYGSSPERCFDRLGVALTELETRIDELEQRQQTVNDLFDTLVKRLATSQARAPAATGWSFDLLQPNLYFGDLYPPEASGGDAKRWVGGTGIIAAKLRLARTLQYELEIQVVDFATPEYERSFFIRVDGRRYPWLHSGNRRYRTIILEDPGSTVLNLEVGVETGPLTEKDITFSFSALEIRSRQ